MASFSRVGGLIFAVTACAHQVAPLRQPASETYGIFLDVCQIPLEKAQDFADELDFRYEFLGQFGPPKSGDKYVLWDLIRGQTASSQLYSFSFDTGHNPPFASMRSLKNPSAPLRYFLLDSQLRMQRCSLEDIQRRAREAEEATVSAAQNQTAGLVYESGDPLVIRDNPAGYAPFVPWFGGVSPKASMRSAYHYLDSQGLNRDETFRRIGRQMLHFVDIAFDHHSGSNDAITLGAFTIRRVNDSKGLQSSPWQDAHWSSGTETEVIHRPSGIKIRVNPGTAHMAFYHQVLESGAENIYATRIEDWVQYLLSPAPNYTFKKDPISETDIIPFKLK
jgi:hypothetical protein